MSIPGSAISLLSAGAGGYQIERSLRFNLADSAYLSRTPASAGNRKTWTWAGWVKRGSLTGDYQTLFSSITAGAAAYSFLVYNSAADSIVFFNSASSTTTTASLFRDPSAWAHVCLAVDTTQATVDAGYKLYINGELQTWASVSGTWTQNADLYINSNDLHTIGSNLPWRGRYFDGYLADIHFIDGQALDPTSFGEFDDNGIWQPIRYAGTYGTNGFHLDFSDNSAATAAALGADSSGNGNNWTPNNLSVTAGAGNDSLVDVPTNGSETDTGVGGEVRGNYCTLNPLDNGGLTLANGNLDASRSTASWVTSRHTIGMSSGKWYWEVTCTASTTGQGLMPGIVNSAGSLATFVGNNSGGYGYNWDANKYNNGTGASYGATFTSGDVISVAFDADSGSITFYKNGTSQGVAYSSIPAGTYFPATSMTGFMSASVNHGQRPFAYTAPSGFKALCTANLPAPTIEDGSTVMDVVLYNGTSATQTISGLGFSPDLVWGKSRTNTYSPTLQDTVRGAGKTIIYSNQNVPENNFNEDWINSFDSNGFTMPTGYYNQSGLSYVAWTWDAGSSTDTNNTAGTITPAGVRANPSSGFSIIKYSGNSTSGATAGHGLGVAPSMVFVKRLNNVTGNDGDWMVGGSNLASWGHYLVLNKTQGQANDFSPFQTPTSSVITLGNSDRVNATGSDYVAYCFASVEGYSAFGSYTGNGSTDGPFVYTGFRPAFVLVKGTGTGLIWTIEDNKRDPYNGTSKYLQPQSSVAEGSVAAPHYDFTSNGFKIRTTDSAWNQNTYTYIYAVFAENPFALNARAR